jgi:signal peptidase II
MEPHRLPLPPRTFIPGFIEFTYAENCGMAFSMLRTAPTWLRTILFSGAALLVTVVMMAMFVRGRGGRLFAVGVPVTLSGAFGNLADRFRHGFVVDFIRFDPDLIHYPTYNVADIALIVGLGLVLIDDWVKPKAAAASPAA